jgi:hypothetical protein
LNRAIPLLIAFVAFAVAGCGAVAADLFAVVRSGSVPGAAFSMIVHDDGTVSCNHVRRMLPDALLIEAREIQSVLEDAAKAHENLRSGPRPVFTYVIATPDGELSFSDDSPHQRHAFFQVAELTHEVATGVCGLPR